MIHTTTAVIAASAALSNAVYVGAGKLVAIITPASWDAATLTFQGSADGVTYNNIYDGTGSETEFQADAARLISVDDYSGTLWIKVRSGTSGSPVNQSVERDLVLVIQRFPTP